MKKNDLMVELRKLEEKRQEEFISKLLDMVDNYADKTNKSIYKPTDKERSVFGRIVNIVNNINKNLYICFFMLVFDVSKMLAFLKSFVTFKKWKKGFLWNYLIKEDV